MVSLLYHVNMTNNIRIIQYNFLEFVLCKHTIINYMFMSRQPNTPNPFKRTLCLYAPPFSFPFLLQKKMMTCYLFFCKKKKANNVCLPTQFLTPGVVIEKSDYSFLDKKIYFLNYYQLIIPNKHYYNVNKSISQFKLLLNWLKNTKLNQKKIISQPQSPLLFFKHKN